MRWGVSPFGGSGEGDPRTPEIGEAAPQGAGHAEEAGDNRERDLPRPPVRLGPRKIGETAFGCEGAGQM